MIGLVSILYLIGYYMRKRNPLQVDMKPSVFGTQEHMGVALYDTPVDRGAVVRGIKAPGLIVFTVLAASSAILTCLIILFADLEVLL